MVLVGLEIDLQVHSEETSERLPESGAERTEESFDNIVARLVRLAFYQLAEHIGLPLGETLQNGLILVENRLFHSLEIILAFLGCGEGLDIFVSLEQGGAYQLGVWQGEFHVADGAPVEFLLLLVLELQRGIAGHAVEDNDGHFLAVDLGHVISAHGTRHTVTRFGNVEEFWLGARGHEHHEDRNGESYESFQNYELIYQDKSLYYITVKGIVKLSCYDFLTGG